MSSVFSDVEILGQATFGNAMGDHRDLVFTEQVLRDLFLSLDTSGDGFLSYQELWDGLNGSDVDWDELNTEKRLVMDRLWVQADRDGNDRVSFAEFWELIAASRSPTETEMTRAFEFFKMLDKSGDGASPSHGRRAPEFRILVGFSPSFPSLPSLTAPLTSPNPHPRPNPPPQAYSTGSRSRKVYKTPTSTGPSWASTLTSTRGTYSRRRIPTATTASHSTNSGRLS